MSSLLNFLHCLLFPRLIFFFLTGATPDPSVVQGGRARFPAAAAADHTDHTAAAGWGVAQVTGMSVQTGGWERWECRKEQEQMDCFDLG